MTVLAASDQELARKCFPIKSQAVSVCHWWFGEGGLSVLLSIPFTDIVKIFSMYWVLKKCISPWCHCHGWSGIKKKESSVYVWIARHWFYLHLCVLLPSGCHSLWSVMRKSASCTTTSLAMRVLSSTCRSWVCARAGSSSAEFCPFLTRSGSGGLCVCVFCNCVCDQHVTGQLSVIVSGWRGWRIVSYCG